MLYGAKKGPASVGPNVWTWTDPLGLTTCPTKHKDPAKKVLADNDVLVYAMDKPNTELGQKALKVIKNNDVHITPNQLNEFARFRGISRSQRQARMAFLKSNGIKVIDKPASISKGADFQEIFTKTAGGQGRGDAALAAFAKETGIEAVTANSKLVRYLDNSLPPSLRGSVPITNLRH